MKDSISIHAAPKPSGSNKKLERCTPKQERSRAIVNAIKQAGLLILKEDGPSKLTTTRISDRAGVSVGSLYRYFSSKEEVVAAIYEEQTKDDLAFVERVTPWFDALKKMPLEVGIRKIIECSIERHRSMMSLHGEVYLKSHRDYSLGSQLSSSLLTTTIRDFLECNRDSLLINDLDKTAFLIARGLSGMLRMTLDEEPGYIKDDSFVEELVLLFTRYLCAETGYKHSIEAEMKPKGCPDWIDAAI
ncbi:TetR family transcriptional regulator [Sinobacterium caligoides]|uniref:TetR family transcriptional regulator n=1 Tax=Sinobacterium caligoides TaxID=933926 RepID=A0A3N2DDP4_9GAMM|nr:TetR/AcrR family transcriptional regulator [Sinobacterium caligoides]ROR97903.1 TetR family transcriptional regulator [Sinobacterium caligoides]